MGTTPRITPLEPPYDPETGEMLERWMPPGGAIEPLALFRTLAVHGELMSRMRPLGSGILNHGQVAPRDREIVLHRTCARAGAEYEWGVHAVAFAEQVGLSAEQLAATAGGADAADDPSWSEQDALLVRLADELHDTATVSDDLWAQLATRYSDQQLLELVVTAGWYRTIAYVTNAARVALEPWAARFPNVGSAT
ncbi:MAG TPA: carboxymuconolactone decarboxylase family protein [Solirubrobacteraceae bacterium]|jgi:alkylhydroperoxidase family enzyme